MTRMRVSVSHTDVVSHVLSCALCMKTIVQYNTQKAGSHTSAAKAKAARENGKLGGRPKKNA